MNQSENIAELAGALAKAQGEMQAAIKDSVNPFFKSKYADLGSVWDAARPVLSKNGLCVIQTTEMIGEKTVLVTTLAHASGQWIKSHLPLNPSKNDSQGVGSAITYLRRYSLSALVGVVCDDDDDGETAIGRGRVEKPAVIAKAHPECKAALHQKTPSPAAVTIAEPLISSAQHETFVELLKETDSEFKKNLETWAKEKSVVFSGMTVKIYESVMRGINNNIAMNKGNNEIS